MSKKISYYDLRIEAAAGKLPMLVGRAEEMDRLDRVMGRRTNNNALLVGPSGIGKTALVWGWMRRLAQNASFFDHALVQFDTEHLHDDSGTTVDALTSLPKSIVFIDDFGREAYKNSTLMQHAFRAYRSILKARHVRVILSLEPQEYAYLEQEFPAFIQLFETITLKNQTPFEYRRILSRVLQKINAGRIIVPDAAVEEVVALAERFPSLGQLPRAGISVLDEAIARGKGMGEKLLSNDSIAHVVEAKTGVPRSRLSSGDLQSIKGLEGDLNSRIVDQKSAIKRIATTLQRAKLGLRNPNRPLGSFLMLGPSGVGKTETAKCVAELIFGRAENVVRFDMSEFQQDHTVQRLIGAPPGYVGFDEGGALTNALRKEPYSLILLDEIEKAHPKVFDIFLQLIDEGRLTSGRNETVDAKNAVIMATSNTAVEEILSSYTEDINEEMFIRETVMPVLTKTFRLEFINRFDSILLFRPLTVQSLSRVAQLEIKKIEKRLAKYNVQFDMESSVIEKKIQHLADPRFGARPIKRFIEETCETLLAESLLSSHSSV